MVVIDSHQHIWDPGRARYDWLGSDLASIDRPFGFGELGAARKRAGIEATVLVQSADNDEDTALMREAATQHPGIVGIVAFAPLDDPRRTRELAEEFAADPTIVGVRNLIHDNPDPAWLLDDRVTASLDVLADHGLTFDLPAVLPQHVMLVAELVRRSPALQVVIDHLAKPPIGRDDREPWWTLIEKAAASPQVFAKVSGLYSSAGAPQEWTSESIRPYFWRAVEVFGPERLMFGSDWPISLTAGGYDRVWQALSGLFSELSPTEREQLTGGTAARFYSIDPKRLASAVSSSRAESSLPTL
ncbi:amidohydrolase family protein [Subtercola endophyticus]|uniref:amidohydrolase family protein n=1 Tax=Subtercola endophyticus TaxID=2895559 RepID=UPI001E5FC9A6|nr:amidohydrolase family protein [Subtercola endophyticus]UFS58725.1 amidohydrolase family protein [Subtercola endophyticus]